MSRTYASVSAGMRGEKIDGWALRNKVEMASTTTTTFLLVIAAVSSLARCTNTYYQYYTLYAHTCMKHNGWRAHMHTNTYICIYSLAQDACTQTGATLSATA